jgi:hypothetical protein
MRGDKCLCSLETFMITQSDRQGFLLFSAQHG